MDQKINLQARKQDARNKIMMDGLFIKAGLSHFQAEHPDVLYGMLLHAKQALSQNPNIINTWKQLGKSLKKNNA